MNMDRLVAEGSYVRKDLLDEAERRATEAGTALVEMERERDFAVTKLESLEVELEVSMGKTGRGTRRELPKVTDLELISLLSRRTQTDGSMLAFLTGILSRNPELARDLVTQLRQDGVIE